MHIGQRDISWVRIAKQAVEKGFSFADIGKILHAMYHKDFGAILDKVQITITTEEAKVLEITEQARATFKQRDARIADLSDESENTYYSCTLCQSFAPSHVCVVTPERTGLCGAYNWLDCKASNEINPNRSLTSQLKKGKFLTSSMVNGQVLMNLFQKRHVELSLTSVLTASCQTL